MTERRKIPGEGVKPKSVESKNTSSEINKTGASTSEAVAEEDPKQKLATLLEDLFLTNFIYKQGKYISPLNADSAGQELSRAEHEKIAKKKELYFALVEVKEAIERDGGISDVIRLGFTLLRIRGSHYFYYHALTSKTTTIPIY
ncbi:type II toxin-antitoxin system HicA family toxin [Candidatus Uhrbacteria bacterium]|nr:type II toxin-antitoxin system HicA family toxin [Candidatus Uhrbacteria bacterium]